MVGGGWSLCAFLPTQCTYAQVETVFVLSRSPFSKASAIQDASLVIPDDHILFVHDADLLPPCGLPDALRQTVVRGVQAVNLLLPYENQPKIGGSISFEVWARGTRVGGGWVRTCFVIVWSLQKKPYRIMSYCIISRHSMSYHIIADRIIS